MESAGIIQLVRHYLNDLSGEVFSDEELYRHLDSVTTDYCTRTAVLRGEVPIRLVDGTFTLPECTLGILRAWNDLGEEIRLGNAHDVEDHLEESGEHVETIYEDLSDDGTYHVWPKVSQDISQLSEDNAYGIVTQLYGAVCAYDYGTTVYLELFENIGSVQIVRKGESREVQDHLALVYGVCARALNSDSDLSSANNARFYERLYQGRSSMRSIITRGNAFAPRRGEYF